MKKTEFVSDRRIYKEVILGQVPKAKQFVWLGSSDLKSLHVDKGGSMVPFLEILSDLIKEKVSVRLIHAKEPGEHFRNDFDKYPNLINGMERILCPRIHLKSVVVDGRFAYIGSANLTGAGMGAKSKDKRNFENGIITTDENLIDEIMAQFDSIWIGKHCKRCGRKAYCSDYKDILATYTLKGSRAV